MHFNLKLFLSTFVLIFLAELGDKTQLAAMAKSIEGRFTVFLAASLALICSTLIAVLFGDALTRIIPERILQIASGFLFLLFGGLILFNSFRAPVAVAAGEEGVCEDPTPFESFIAQTALVFEEAAEADYRRLAEKEKNEGLRNLFLALADEEKGHREQLLEACHGSGDEAVEPTDTLPDLTELVHDVAADASPALEHAIGHELATARFYEHMAERASLPGLKHSMAKLAEEEYGHAERLRALLVV